MSYAVHAVSVILIAAGFLFFCATSVGIIRFPDFYCRMHAAGKGDTLSTMLILAGLALLNVEHLAWGAVLVSVKILFIAVFIFLASPTATHAIIDAGFHSGIKPWTHGDPREACDAARQDAAEDSRRPGEGDGDGPRGGEGGDPA